MEFIILQFTHLTQDINNYSKMQDIGKRDKNKEYLHKSTKMITSRKGYSMKKIILSIVLVIIVILIFAIIVITRINEANMKSNKIYNFNLFFEKYKDKTFYGTEVLTIINKAIDLNEENKFSRNGQEQDNISVEIIFIYTDEDENIIEKKSRMEELEKAGLNNFIARFSLTEFKFEKIEYNNQKRVKNVVIKQVEL